MKKLGEYAIVTAQAFNRKTGEEVGDKRDEKIDLKNNILFKDCKCVLHIKQAYERFWNDLNKDSRDIVVVWDVKA